MVKQLPKIVITLGNLVIVRHDYLKNIFIIKLGQKMKYSSDP